MKPNTLKDLLGGGHIAIHEVDTIARGLFDGKTTAAGPEGYVITAVNFNDLPEHVRGFIRKAVLEFKVTNVLDDDYVTRAHDQIEQGDSVENTELDSELVENGRPLDTRDDLDPVGTDGNDAEPPTVDGEVT